MMSFLFTIEEAFEIFGRGYAIVPALAEESSFNIQARDAIQLCNLEGHTLDTHIASIEIVKTINGSRIAICLPSSIQKGDVSRGTGVWLKRSR
jgi:hypothetical protein